LRKLGALETCDQIARANELTLGDGAGFYAPRELEADLRVCDLDVPLDPQDAVVVIRGQHPSAIKRGA